MRKLLKKRPPFQGFLYKWGQPVSQQRTSNKLLSVNLSALFWEQAPFRKEKPTWALAKDSPPDQRGVLSGLLSRDSMSSCLACWQMGPWIRPNPGPLSGTSVTSGILWFYNSETAGYMAYSHGPIGGFTIWTQNAHVFHKEWEKMNKVLLHV